MRSVFTKITSFTLAVLVLISTLSLNVEKHFCGDFLVDISYFGESDGCGDEAKSCDSVTVIKEKKCCKDEVEKIDGQDDLNISSLEKETFKQQFALAFTISYNNLFVCFKQQDASLQYYSPPNLITDIQLFHEVFII